MISGIKAKIDYAAHKQLHGAKNWDRLSDQCKEECAELIVALSHHKRGRIDVPFVIEEMADVIICIDALLQTLPEPDAKLLTAQLNFKILRMNDRVHSALDQLDKGRQPLAQLTLELVKEAA